MPVVESHLAEAVDRTSARGSDDASRLPLPAAALHDGSVPFATTGGAPLPPPPSPPLPPVEDGPTWLSRHRGFNIGAQISVAAIALGGCLYVSAVDPNTERGVFPPCPFKAYTGLDCPGCGLTRAVRALITGDPVRALDHNILILVMLPVGVYAYLRWIASSFGKELPALRMKPWMGWAFAVVVVAYWVVRNLPGPFQWLASTASTA